MKRMLTMGVVGLLMGSSLTAAAGVPTDQLKRSTDRVLELVRDPTLQGPSKTEVRRREIRAVADEIFDWQTTGRRALARHWQPLSAGQRAEFSTLFADLVEQSYVSKIEAYTGETIRYLGENVAGDEATVHTKLVTKSNTEVSIDYRMAKEGDRWRVYDVVIEGVSLVNNYRSQFNRIIAQLGYDELVKKMKTKQQELRFEPQPSKQATP